MHELPKELRQHNSIDRVGGTVAEYRTPGPNLTPDIKMAYKVVSSYCTTAIESAKAFSMTGITNSIGQTSTAYTLSRGVANVGVEEVRRTGNEHAKVIHIVPIMTDMERNAAKKRIGSDLYEIFMRIQAELHFDNDFTQK